MLAFPYESVPDGAVFAPHHYTYFALLALLIVAIVWDNYPNQEPVLVAVFIGAGLFGFLSVWPFYPVAGAMIAVVAPPLSIASVLLGWIGLSIGDVWDDYPVRYRLLVIVALLSAWDDALEHAFGLPMPLDQLWKAGLHGYSPLLSGVILLGVAAWAVWEFAGG